MITDETVRAYGCLLSKERDDVIRAKNRILKRLTCVPGISIDALTAGQFGGSTGLPESDTPTDNARLIAIARSLLSQVVFNFIKDALEIRLQAHC